MKEFLIRAKVCPTQAIHRNAEIERDRFQFSRSERDGRQADLAWTADFQPSGCARKPFADGQRSFVAGELGDHRGRHDHAAVQCWKDVLVLDQNQVLQRRGVGDDDHSTNRSAAGRMSECSLTLLTQARARLALALEVLDGVLEWHAVTLKERVQVVP